MSNEPTDYGSVKTLARKLGCHVTDLLALASINDPFYMGTPANLAQAHWFAGLWRKGEFSQGAHLRRLHYWCLSQPRLRQANGLPYKNTVGCFKYLCQASKVARYLGLVKIADIADHKNPEPQVFADYKASRSLGFRVDSNVHELEDPDIEITGFDRAAIQRYHLEVWVEKSSMNDVLLPVCRDYGANLVIGEGELSITAVHRLMLRLAQAQKPARIFYMADFDPAGLSMPRSVARKIEWMARQTGTDLDVKLHHLVLTREQVEEYALPRTPIKEGERRVASFEAQHGEGAVELDALEALHPGVLGRIVREALDCHYDHDAASEACAKEKKLWQAISEQVEEITDRYSEHIDALQSMAAELESLDIEDLDEYEPPEAKEENDAGRCWLLDTGRTYLDQMDVYKQHANHGDGEPGAA